MVWILAGAVGLVGCVFLMLGLMGRRRGDAPHCRSCNFELTGLVESEPDQAQSEPARPSRCPECGCDLHRPQAVAKGKHQRLVPLILVGGVVCVVALGLAALAVSASNSSYNSMKPTWLLIVEATKFHGKASDAAAAELLKRYSKKRLSPDQLKAIVPGAFHAQRVVKNSDWLQSPWIELLDAAFTKNLISEEQLAEYGANVFASMDARIPSAMLAGDSWPEGTGGVSYDLMPDRNVPVVPAQPVYFTAPLIAASVDGKSLPLKPKRSDRDGEKPVWYGLANGYGLMGVSGSYTQRESTASCIVHDSESYDILPWHTTPGIHTIKLTYAVKVYAGMPPRRTGNGASPKLLASWTQTVEHTFTAYKTAEEIATLVGPDAYPGFHPVLTLSSMSSAKANTIDLDQWLPMSDGKPTYRVMMSIKLKPVNTTSNQPLLAGHIEFRHNGDTWVPVSSWKRTDGQYRKAFVALGLIDGTFYGGISFVPLLPADFPHFDTVDVVLVPDLHEAARAGYQREIWNQEIVIKDVNLDWSAIDGQDDEQDDQ